MPRPKGSKNRQTIEVEKLQNRIIELEKQHNSYDEVLDSFVEGFVIDLFNQGTLKTISLDTLQTWFNNPDRYMTNISNLLTYYYIIDGNIFQLYDLIFSLPELDYKVTALKKDKGYKEDIYQIKYHLEKKILHKELTRDLLVQLAHDGTLLGTWLGNTNNPYFYTFSNLKYIYPYGRSQGKMIGVIDLKWLDDMKEEERELIYKNLSPLVTKNKYEKFKNNNDSNNEQKVRYVSLPPDKSLVARIHTLNRNQRLGVPFGTQALFDIQHKQKMKELEKSIADKIIRAMAILKFSGKDDNDIKVKETAKRKVLKGVQKAIEKSSKDSSGITCLAMPDFANLEFSEIKNGDKVLNPEKYESTDNDITTSTGVSQVLTNGTKGNYASAKLNLDVLYKKIGVMLEKIEEIYNQLIVTILGEEKGGNYIFEYNKDTPIEREKKLDTLMKLQSQGFSTKHVLDILGIDSDEYFEQSLYEIEDLDLREKIIPPSISYTQSGKDNGRPTNSSPTNDSTIQSTEVDGNTTPKAGI